MSGLGLIGQAFRERWIDWIVPVSVQMQWLWWGREVGAAVGWGGTRLLFLSLSVLLSLAHSPEIFYKLIQIRALFSAQASSLTFPPGRVEERGRWSRCTKVHSNRKRNDWKIRQWVLLCFRDNVCVCVRVICKTADMKNCCHKALDKTYGVPVFLLIAVLIIKICTVLAAQMFLIFFVSSAVILINTHSHRAAQRIYRNLVKQTKKKDSMSWQIYSVFMWISSL